MSRTGYFLFCIVLTALVYGAAYMSGGRHEVLIYTATYFSAPVTFANFVMAILFLVGWFMKQDPEVARAGITFLHAVWLTALLGFCGYILASSGGTLGGLIKALPH